VRVLGHGARADGPPGLRITVLDTGTPAREIALGRSGPAQPEPTTGPAGRSYADWRTELLGMMAAQS